MTPGNPLCPPSQQCHFVRSDRVLREVDQRGELGLQLLVYMREHPTRLPSDCFIDQKASRVHGNTGLRYL